ncbi:CYN23 [Auxenochlorella protothecoides x Auxenochlorella symbiontica]
MSKGWTGSLVIMACLAVAVAGPDLSNFRAVFQTDHGDIHMAFYANVAPKTVDLIYSLMEAGAYNTNHFFRVDKGFVAQTADVAGGRLAAMDWRQRDLAAKHVPLEVTPAVKHDKRGVLSLARHSDPESGGSSFSILLGPAPHLDMQYTVFGCAPAWRTSLGGLCHYFVPWVCQAPWLPWPDPPSRSLLNAPIPPRPRQ